MPPFSPSVERDDAPPIDLEDYLAPDPESGEERPTFGARIAGDVPKPIPPNVAAPEDKQPAPPVQYDPGKVPEGIFAPKSPPPAPVGANNPALVSLLNRQAQDSQRINPYQTDPQTGKRTTLPQYRMGTGMRILGSIANFASGFGGKGPVAYVGPGATNARYQQDETQRQANLASDELQIKGQQGLDTENLKLEREAQRQAFEGVKGEAAKQTAAARLQTADAQQQVADTRQQLADLKANSIDQRIADANKMSLKGEDRKYYIANGKLKEPSPLDDIRQELARQRLDDAKQARVDKVQKDAEAEMTAHKASIQKRIDALSKQVDLGEIDDSTDAHILTVALRCQVQNGDTSFILALRCIICAMSGDDQVSRIMSEMGRRGGLARAKKLTAKQRKESAIKASEAAAKARSKKAADRKKKAQS